MHGTVLLLGSLFLIVSDFQGIPAAAPQSVRTDPFEGWAEQFGTGQDLLK